MGSWMRFIQKRMVTGCSLVVIARVMTKVSANPAAEYSTANAAGSTIAAPGLRMTRIPTNPRRIPPVRRPVSGSRRRRAASTAVQIGEVNSRAMTSPRGSRISP